MARRDNERAARVLAEAALQGDATVAASYNLSIRTVERYREALGSDKELSEKFMIATRELLNRSWADDLNLAITKTIGRLLEHLEGLVVPTPQSVSAITEALKTLSEIAITREVLNAGNAKQNTGYPAQGRETPPHTGAGAN